MMRRRAAETTKKPAPIWRGALIGAAILLGGAAESEREPQRESVRDILLALSLAPDSERAAWRWRLARDYAARGLYAEADGVLRVLAKDTPERAESKPFRLLQARVSNNRGDATGALHVLDTPIVEGAAEACLERLRATSRLGSHQAAEQNLGCAEAAIAALAPADKTPAVLAAVRSLAAIGKLEDAEYWLQRIEAANSREAGEVDFWRGIIAARRGQSGLALDHFAAARQSPHPVAALRALVAEARLRVKAGAMTAEDAIQSLKAARFDWRGGAAERDLLLALGDFSERIGDTRGVFEAYGAAALYLPSDQQLERRLSERFSKIFADGGSALEPVEAFSLFWDYRHFAPQGPEADAMIRKLAGRLADLGLRAQAASLLEHQVYNRLEGTAQAIVAARLAELFNDSGHFDRALTVLAATRSQGVPDPVAQRRKFAEVRALIAAGRSREAKTLLGRDQSAKAKALRAEAAWASRDWAAVIVHLQPVLPAADELDDGAALAKLLRLTVAAVMDGDAALLRTLARSYETALAGTDIGPAFSILTGEPGRVAPEVLRSALETAAAAATNSNLLLEDA